MASSRSDRSRLVWRLSRELLSIMLQHPWLLLLAILPNILTPALEPAKAWITKEVLNEVSKGDHLFLLTDLLSYAPIAVGVFLVLGLLKMAEKITSRMLNDRLLIDLQRAWFDRRTQDCIGAQVARSMNDCENARKILDLFQKEFWRVSVGLPAVIIWQLSLSPTMLPALLVASIVPFLTALLFGGLIQQYSSNILKLVSNVSSAVATGNKEQLYSQQELFYKNRIRFEFWKQSSEVTADFAYWLGLVMVLLLAVFNILPVLPEAVSATEIGVFLVNLKLINSPLSDISKVYNKVREAWPAVVRTLAPTLEEPAYG